MLLNVNYIIVHSSDDSYKDKYSADNDENDENDEYSIGSSNDVSGNDQDKETT